MITLELREPDDSVRVRIENNESAEERASCRISRRGLHWESLNEDVSIAGLLAGYGDQTRSIPEAAK